MIRVLAVKDVDHASTSRFARGPETFVVIKIEDQPRVRTKATRNDKWLDEGHDIDIDKANEIEITVYDKPSDHPMPVGMLWIRISDLAEEMRRKKLEQEINSSGWVSADKMGEGQHRSSDSFGHSSGTPAAVGANNPGIYAGGPNRPPQQQGHLPTNVDTWFALEPVGQIHLSLNFGTCLVVIKREILIAYSQTNQGQTATRYRRSWPARRCPKRQGGSSRNVRA